MVAIHANLQRGSGMSFHNGCPMQKLKPHPLSQSLHVLHVCVHVPAVQCPLTPPPQDVVNVDSVILWVTAPSSQGVLNRTQDMLQHFTQKEV